MALSRKEYLEICQTCSKSTFTSKKGLVCSLTNEHANFDTNCDTYQADEKAVKRQTTNKKRAENELLDRKTMGISSLSTNSKITTGIVLIILGIAMLILLVIVLDRIVFYSFFLVALGIFSLLLGIKEKNAAKDKNRNDILDDL